MMRPFSVSAIVRHRPDGRIGAIVLGPHRAPVGMRWVSFDRSGDSATLIDKVELQPISKRELAKRRTGHVD
jgi:hypothetical protein